MFAEMWMERIARTIGRPVHEVRASNMQNEGYVTHYGQPMTDCRIKTCWEQVMKTSNFNER